MKLSRGVVEICGVQFCFLGASRRLSWMAHGSVVGLDCF